MRGAMIPFGAKRAGRSRRATHIAGAIAAAALLAPTAAGGATVSSNWAGYAAQAPSHSAFDSVSGVWRMPSATCVPGRESFSAVWVGLGGYSANANSLEQIGVDADCSRGGRAVYSSWYELLPAASVRVAISPHAGDELAASVTVSHDHVTLRLRDLSSKVRFSLTRTAAEVDASSAEWIVEAPSVCAFSDRCRALPLSNFGEVAFATATATAGGHTGAILDPSWSSSSLELRQRLPATSAGAGAAASTVFAAVASSPPSGTGAFSVSWQERSA